MAGSHPVATVLGFLMAVAFASFLAIVLGLGALTTSGKLTADRSDSMGQIKQMIGIWRDSSVPRLVKWLAFGGILALFACVLLMWILIEMFGS